MSAVNFPTHLWPKDARLDLPENQQKLERLEAWLRKHADKLDELEKKHLAGGQRALRYGDYDGGGTIEKIALQGGGSIKRVTDKEGNVQSVCITVDGKTQVFNSTLRPGVLLDSEGKTLELKSFASADGQRMVLSAGGDLQDMNGKTLDVKDKQNYDYVTHKFWEVKREDGKIEFQVERSYECENWLNYNRWTGTVIDTIGETRKFGEKEMVPVCSTGNRYELVRADDLDGILGWRSWQKYVYHHGRKVATLVMDVGMTVSGLEGAAVAWREARYLNFAWNGLRAAAGLSGFAVPALRANCPEFGHSFETGRAYFFLADITLGLAPQKLYGWWAGAQKTQEAVSMVKRVNDVGMLAGGLAMVPGIVVGIRTSWERYNESSPADQLEKASNRRNVPEELRHFLRSEAVSQGSDKSAAIQSSAAVLADWANTLSQSAQDARIRKAVDNHLTDIVPRAMREGGAAAEQAKSQLVSVLTRRASDARSVSPEEKVAAAIALLSLCTDANGKIPDGVLARSAQSSVTKDYLIYILKLHTSTANKDSVRLVAGDALWRVGAIKNHQLAGICLDVLNSKSASDDLKARALLDTRGSRLATLLHDLKIDEIKTRDDQSTNRFGLRSTDIEKALLAFARTTKNDDLKCLAGRILYVNGESDEKQLAVLLGQCMADWVLLRGETGRFALETVKKLQTDLNLQIPEATSNTQQAGVQGAEKNAAQTGLTPDSAESVRWRIFRAALLLKELEGSLPAGTASGIDFNQHLLRCICQAEKSGKGGLKLNLTDMELTARAIAALDCKTLNPSVRDSLIALLAADKSTTTFAAKVAIMAKLGEFIEHAGADSERVLGNEIVK